MRNLFILLVGMIVVSCNTNYEKTKSGLRYKIIKGKGGKQLKHGDFIQFHQAVLIPERDTTLFTSYGKMHAYFQVDTSSRGAYTFMEVLPKMRVGDSLVMIINADSLLRKGMIASYNEVIRRGDLISIRMRITNSFATEAEMNVVAKKEAEAQDAIKAQEAKEQQKKDQAVVDEYITKNKINAIKTPSGAYVEVLEKGTGKAGDTGAIAQIFYTGKLLKDGTVFDSNIDPKFKHTEGLNIELGTGRLVDMPGGGAVVKGFSEGLMYTGKGGRARIYIPSFLGYGSQGGGPIPANAALIFEIETRNIISASAIVPQPDVEAPHGH